MKLIGSLIVSWDFTNGKDHDVFMVGRQENGRIRVLNVFLGEEARDLYDRIVGTRKESKKEENNDDCS